MMQFNKNQTIWVPPQATPPRGERECKHYDSNNKCTEWGTVHGADGSSDSIAPDTSHHVAFAFIGGFALGLFAMHVYVKNQAAQ